MSKTHLTAGVFCTTLLQACVTAPTMVEKPMEPVFRVNHSSHAAASTYYQLGRFHQQRGRLDLASEAFAHSVKLDAKDLDARNALAIVYSQQGKLDEAKALLLSIIDDHPQVPHAYNNLGYLHSLQGDFTGAIRHLERALQLDPRSERARNNLEAAQLALKGPSDAASQASAVRASNSTPAPLAPTSHAHEQAKAVDISGPRLQSHIVQIAPNVYELKMDAASATVDSGKRTAPVAASVPSPAQANAKAARVQIANGNGVTNMASRVRAFLNRQGIGVDSLANARPYVHQETTIAYRQGHEHSAQSMRVALGDHGVLVPSADLPPHLDLRVVLGKQAVTQLAGLDQRSLPLPPVIVGDATAR